MQQTPKIKRIGQILSGTFGLFMLGASVFPKLAGLAVADETMRALGWENSPVLLIGIIEALATALYLFPRTMILGAVLLTAIMGGAIATQMQAGSPLFSHTLFGVYLGLWLWAGAWFQCPRLRAILPLR